MQKLTSSYVIVIKESTYAEQNSQQIADLLLQKHQKKKAKVITFQKSIMELQYQLSQTWNESTEIMYTCFLTTIEELAKTAFFRDIFMQTLWGIVITDADHDVKRLLEIDQLPIKKVLSGTQFHLNAVNSGIVYSELKQCQAFEKNPDEQAKEFPCSKDTSHEMIDHLNTSTIDCMITSGHARQTEWNIGFSFKSGQFVPKNGKIAGKNIQGECKEIVADNPKIINAVGNCLLGNVNNKECMAVNWMGSGAIQLAGYTGQIYFMKQFFLYNSCYLVWFCRMGYQQIFY